MKTMAMAVALVCAMAASASAADLGERGAVSINGSFQLELSNSSTDADNDESITHIVVAPNGDYFVAPNVSLGGGFLISYFEQGDASSTSLGLQARIGYYLPLGSAGIWLLVGGAYSHGLAQATFLGVFEAQAESDVFALQAFLPVIIHLAPGFFFGLGPAATQEVIRDTDNDLNENKRRVLGIFSVVGGAW
jgi:hypothetical protein